ncbi:hypothetical protein [Sulfuracidifex metallicus]|nr:hypothetical protein [Sulfuracidifex metallicus]WOE49874.1 hypothetical protein RQ359_001364 [Sulfuracidifex metallicus DSM 6482 = JCM 9184]
MRLSFALRRQRGVEEIKKQNLAERTKRKVKRENKQNNNNNRKANNVVNPFPAKSYGRSHENDV